MNQRFVNASGQKVGFQGVAGAYSEGAIMQLFSSKPVTMGYETFDQVNFILIL